MLCSAAEVLATGGDLISMGRPWFTIPSEPVSDMRVLGLDAATAACSAALLEDGRILAEAEQPMQHGHAEALLPIVQKVMTGTSFAGLDAIAVTVGPGGFTGIRVGLAAARGLGLAAKKPVLGVTTFAAIAHAARRQLGAGQRLLVLVESKRADVYAQLFAPDLSPLREPAALLPEQLPGYVGEGALLLAGDGCARVAALFPDALLAAGDGRPQARCVAALGAARLRRSGPPAAPPRALYLRAPDVTLPRSGGGT